MSKYNQVLLNRSESTPLVMGAHGNRYDLVLKSLYYYTNYKGEVHQGDIDFIRRNQYGIPIPLHIKYTAQKFYKESDETLSVLKIPVICTHLSYFEYRNFKIKKGTNPLFIGDAVIGSKVSRKL